jgi:predicted nucleic acid-binding protein
MIENAYFFDTYAFFEILKDNVNYAAYRYSRVATTQFNLAEFSWVLERENRPHAEEMVRHRSESLVPVETNDIISAMKLRTQNKKLSIPDVIGYTVAKRLGIKFLTGDKEFEHMENVEYVK